MSGSSLDGLDICLVAFSKKNKNWSFKIEDSATLDIPFSIKEKLKFSTLISSEDLAVLDVDYGKWIGKCLKNFIIDKNAGSIDLVAVHGHTVFHEPENNISVQIGNAGEIVKQIGIPLIDNFRIDDIINGGQGAPLVPAGEYYLFDNYDGFVNLGGISNISIFQNEAIRAWDICPCNQALNYFSSKLGYPYDKEGIMAKSGLVDDSWLDKLLKKSYFSQSPPKSLSNSWGVENVLQECQIEPKNALRTYTELITILLRDEIVRELPVGSKVLFTGGGTFNDFLIENLKSKLINTHQIIVPEKNLIEFKEAMIFGFLGLLKWLKIPNVLATVTGARKDTIAGTITYPKKYNSE